PVLPHDLPSFPTRRSSDLASSAYSSGSSDLFVHAATATRTEHSATAPTVRRGRFVVMEEQPSGPRGRPPPVDDPHRYARDAAPGDRKSTRLNSSHVSISYA